MGKLCTDITDIFVFVALCMKMIAGYKILMAFYFESFPTSHKCNSLTCFMAPSH